MTMLCFKSVFILCAIALAAACGGTSKNAQSAKILGQEKVKPAAPAAPNDRVDPQPGAGLSGNAPLRTSPKHQTSFPLHLRFCTPEPVELSSAMRLIKRLNTLPEVHQFNAFGMPDKTVRIVIDPDRMANFGITDLDDIVYKIENATSVDGVKNTILVNSSLNDTPVALKDIASVKLTHEHNRQMAWHNDCNAVYFKIVPQNGVSPKALYDAIVDEPVLQPRETIVWQKPQPNMIAMHLVSDQPYQMALNEMRHLVTSHDLGEFLFAIESEKENGPDRLASNRYRFTVLLDVPDHELPLARQHVGEMAQRILTHSFGLHIDGISGIPTVEISCVQNGASANAPAAAIPQQLDAMGQLQERMMAHPAFAAAWIDASAPSPVIDFTPDANPLVMAGIPEGVLNRFIHTALEGRTGQMATKNDETLQFRLFLGETPKRIDDLLALRVPGKNSDSRGR